MYDRYYGTSSYRSTPPIRPEEPQRSKFPKLKLPKFKGIGRWILIILACLFVLLWLFLGSFRFLMTRFPALTGFPFGQRTYLVLFQNNYELRPTGGFISTYGEVKFRFGLPSGIEFFDVYGEIDEHERVEPPLVLSTLLDGEGYQGHSFRDANFDPDFNKAKEELLEFYTLTHPDDRVDGIIAADFTMLERMVAMYEPLRVEDYELTEENLFETLSTAVSDIDRHDVEALANRKNITSPIVQKVIKKSLILPWRFSRFLDLVKTGFDEKHVLASFNRKRLEKPFAKRGWDGGLPDPDAGDVLIVNDANYGGMKSNRYITRDVQYELEMSSAKDVLGNPLITATVTVMISHEGGWNTPLSGPYTGYLRVLIPRGSDVELGSTITEERSDFEVLGEIVELDPGESTSFTYRYILPEYVWTDGSYHLTLNKQPGTTGDRYRVVIKAPQGMRVAGGQLDVRENVAFFETNLAEDEELEVSLLPDEEPPHVVMHNVSALNEITVIFNEAISPDYAGDALRYTLADSNAKNPSVTDKLIIESIRVDGSAIILTTTGMTSQPEEQYKLTVKDIRDLSGNVITPTPRTLTVVQPLTFEEPEEEVEEEPTETEEETPEPPVADE